MSKKAIVRRKGSWDETADFIKGNQPKPPRKSSPLIERLNKIESLLKDNK